MLDYVMLEEDLTQEQQLIKETTRDFVESEIRPKIADNWLDGTLSEEFIPKMGDLGFFGANLSGYGLPDVSEIAYGLIMQELEACDSGIRSFASVQGALVMYPIHAFGSDSQKEEWLPSLAKGESVGCFGLTEPGHGSDPGRLQTTAVAEPEGYRINGSKTWITNAPIADIAIVWARDTSLKDDPIRGFLVETDRDGVSTQEIKGKLSLRTSVTGEISLQDAVIPEENVLPLTEGIKSPFSCLNQARYGIAWGAVGAARDCFEAARGYALDREQWGGPIAGFQLQQEKLAEMATQITLAQLLAYRLGELKERDKIRHQQISMAKRNNVAMARDMARIAREMIGGNGITVDYPPMRHLANMETVYTYEGTHDIHSLVLGKDLTGIGAFEA